MNGVGFLEYERILVQAFLLIFSETNEKEANLQGFGELNINKRKIMNQVITIPFSPSMLCVT